MKFYTPKKYFNEIMNFLTEWGVTFELLASDKEGQDLWAGLNSYHKEGVRELYLKDNMINIFDEKGNFTKENFDPYRYPDYDDYWYTIFDDDGELNCTFDDFLTRMLNTRDYRYNCDAVMLYHASVFSGSTKGNYTAIYMWR